MPDDEQHALGAEIRRRRRDLGLTIVSLAEQAQISHPFLSQLERGLARPSMMTLARLAEALGTTQVELMIAADTRAGAEGKPGSIRVVRSHDGLQLPRGIARAGSEQGSTRLLVHGRAAFYPQEFIEVHTDFGPYFVHDEDEWLYVVAGSIVADLGDHGQARLTEGDSLYYTGGTPHRWRVVDCASARLIVVKAAGRPETGA
ncbi:helix-turn-helix domain-containing protein [Nocardia sp. alder85J]|uniref:helix-turn-helix domain-containing protein n=1 Tax=Nocardia sp. alder85J TaxID=2862949 RepID=UPI001CD6487E|nr:XRE family transcriptional regulator [Nocardia sp. alder85J]MCX4095175.1 XRE family transcriptional regulator [Nocardia sp. alder85J]